MWTTVGAYIYIYIYIYWVHTHESAARDLFCVVSLGELIQSHLLMSGCQSVVSISVPVSL